MLPMQRHRSLGFFSIPVVGMTAVFTGAVLALQTYTGFTRFSAENTIDTITIYNMLGQEVMLKQINSKDFTLDISNLSTGTYIAKLNSIGELKSIKFTKL